MTAASLVAGTVATATQAGAVGFASEAVVVPGTTTPLHGGGSAATFGVVLPAGASCPGDTAHDQYRVYSFLVPAGVALTSVSYRAALPARWYGFIAGGAYYGAVNTAEGTGQIVDLPPAFTFSRLTPSELFGTSGSSSSAWTGGIACVNTRGVVTNAWSSQFRFVRDATDPGGFRWSVTGSASVSSSGGNSWLWIGFALVGVAVLVAGAALLLQGGSGRRSDGADDDGPGRGGGPRRRGPAGDGGRGPGEVGARAGGSEPAPDGRTAERGSDVAVTSSTAGR